MNLDEMTTVCIPAGGPIDKPLYFKMSRAPHAGEILCFKYGNKRYSFKVSQVEFGMHQITDSHLDGVCDSASVDGEYLDSRHFMAMSIAAVNQIVSSRGERIT